MADRIKSKKPVPTKPAGANADTKPAPRSAEGLGGAAAEELGQPQHNTTEPYGKSSEQARRATKP